MYNGTETLTFLGPRIWEIVPDYIKKSNSFEEFKLKKSYGIQKSVHAGYAKGSFHKLVFYNMLFNFYVAYCITFTSHFYFVNFKSVWSFIVIFKPGRQKTRILAGVCN